MHYKKVHVFALLWLLQNIALKFLLSAASPTVFNSDTLNHVKPTNSYLQSLRSEYDSLTNSSNEKYNSNNLTDDKIKGNTYKDFAINNEPSTPNKVKEYKYDSKRDASIDDKGNSITKIQESKSNSSGISNEQDGEIVDKKRSQIASNIDKEVSSSFQESVASFRKSRGITYSTDMFKRESKNKLEIPNELSSNPGNYQHLIRSKRRIFRRSKNASHLSHLHKRHSSTSKKKRSKYSKAFNVHKRLIDRSVQSTSPKTFIKDILDMMKSRETPVTITAKTGSETTAPVVPVKFKKDIVSKMNDDAADKMRKNTIPNSKMEHTNNHFINTRKRSQINTNHKTARSYRKSDKERHTSFNQKHHYNHLDKDIRRRGKPMQLQDLKYLEKRQEEPELMTMLPSSSEKPTIATTVSSTQQFTTVSTAQQVTTVSKSIAASDKVDESSTVAPEINSTLKSLDENQKNQLMKFTSDLKTFVWNYIEGQSGLNDTRKKFVLGKVLKSLPGLIMKHINEVI